MARARRRASAPLPAWVAFEPVEGRPVVPQHEEWSRDFIEWHRGPGTGALDLEGVMDCFRSARDTAVRVAEERGEFYTSSSLEWARHVLGPNADPREVDQLMWELHDEWKAKI